MQKSEQVLDSWRVDHSSLPVGTQTDYSKDQDKYIIDYQEVEHVKMIGDKDTEFVKTLSVEECSRSNRQEYISSFDNEVGILNIMKKVALTGDASLLNQTKRVSLPGTDKDALGRQVEDVADYSQFVGVDRAEALNSFKQGRAVFASLPDSLKGDKSFEEVAKMSDADVDAYIKAQVDAYKAQVAAIKASQEGGK